MVISPHIIICYHTALLGNLVIPFLGTTLVFPEVVQASIGCLVRKHSRFNFDTEGSSEFYKELFAHF